MTKEYRTLTFVDSPSGRRKMDEVINQFSNEGWSIKSKETAPQDLSHGSTCCLGCILLPIRSKKKGLITVIMEREVDPNHKPLVHEEANMPTVQSDIKPWYKKWWGILLIILSIPTYTFPIVILIIVLPNKKVPSLAKIAICLFIVIVAIGIFQAEHPEYMQKNKDIKSQQQTANEELDKFNDQQAEEKQKQEVARVYQETVDTYAPIYCANHQDITVNEPVLSKDGWPLADNQKGITEDDCEILIGLLYIQRVDYANRVSLIKSIAEKKVAIGMTKVEVVYAWGSPNDINKTTSAGGTWEQWVFGSPIYGGNYVYFDNNIVTSMQSN